MKEVSEKRINGIGLFLGATAYGFVHAPIIAVKKVKKEIEENKKKKDYERYMKTFEKYLRLWVTKGSISDQAAEKIWQDEEIYACRKYFG